MIIKNLISFILFFLCTTRSWYGAEFGLSFDNFSLFLILFIILNLNFSSIKLIQNELNVMLLLIFAITFGLVRTIHQVNDEIKLLTSFSILLYSILCFLLISNIRNNNWKSSFNFAIYLVLSIHISFLFLQIFGILLGYDIDFYLQLTGNSGRNIGGVVDNLGLGYFFRPSGLFDEPGTYSANIAILLCLYLLLNNNKVDVIVFFALLSIFLSFSTQGIFNAMIISFTILINSKNLSKFFFIIIILSVGVLSSYYAIYERFFTDEFLLDSSSLIRMESIANALSSFWGNGFIVPKIAIADSTTLIYWYWYMGISVLPLIVVFSYFSLINNAKLGLLFFVLFTSKIPPTAPLYWLTISVGFSILFNQAIINKNKINNIISN